MNIIQTSLPYTKNWRIYRGMIWRPYVILKDEDGVEMDLTNYKSKLTIRKRRGGDELITLTSDPASGITITTAEGKIAVEMDTIDINVPSAVYDWYVEDAGGEPVYLLEGSMTFIQNVTEPIA